MKSNIKQKIPSGAVVSFDTPCLRIFSEETVCSTENF